MSSGRVLPCLFGTSGVEEPHFDEKSITNSGARVSIKVQNGG